MKSIENVKNFLKGLITSETSTDDVQKYQGLISEIEEVEQEQKSTSDELAKCKDTIVSLVNHQGSAKPPKDDVNTQPRSLEEIAQSVINGGK